MFSLYSIATLGLDRREMIYDTCIDEILLCCDFSETMSTIGDISEIDLLDATFQRVIATSSCEREWIIIVWDIFEVFLLSFDASEPCWSPFFLLREIDCHTLSELLT
jgi:hypothetical protein